MAPGRARLDHLKRSSTPTSTRAPPGVRTGGWIPPSPRSTASAPSRATPTSTRGSPISAASGARPLGSEASPHRSSRAGERSPRQGAAEPMVLLRRRPEQPSGCGEGKSKQRGRRRLRKIDRRRIDERVAHRGGPCRPGQELPARRLRASRAPATAQATGMSTSNCVLKIRFVRRKATGISAPTATPGRGAPLLATPAVRESTTTSARPITAARFAQSGMSAGPPTKLPGSSSSSTTEAPPSSPFRLPTRRPSG